MPEQQICGETKVQGGEYEWVCTKPPHGPKTLVNSHNQDPIEVGDHAFKAFKKVA